MSISKKQSIDEAEMFLFLHIQKDDCMVNTGKGEQGEYEGWRYQHCRTVFSSQRHSQRIITQPPLN